MQPDITFSGNTPYVSWQETGPQRFVGHLAGAGFVVDTPGGIPGAEPDLRAPVSSNCIATPFDADGDACQGGVAPQAFFLHLQAGAPKRLIGEAVVSRRQGGGPSADPRVPGRAAPAPASAARA